MLAKPVQEPALPTRQIRIFLSAPGEELAEVRAEIRNRVIPLLRRKFERRGLSVLLVDFSEGCISDSQPQLKWRLEEIKLCHPYFIGILGRSAQVLQSELHGELVAENSWLAKFRNKPIADVEAEAGAFRASSTQAGVFFYDLAGETDVGSGGVSASHANLRSKVKKAGFPFCENLKTAADLGDRVFADLQETMELVSGRTEPTPSSRIRFLQEAFATALRDVFLPRPGAFKFLDEYLAQKPKLPLLITGPLGSGKSALLANWADHHKRLHPEDLVMVHHLEASAESARDTVIYRRLINKIQRNAEIPVPVPTTEEGLRQSVFEWLQMASPWGRTIIVLDGLHLLESERKGALPAWLETTLPDRVWLILSGQTDSPGLECLVRMGCPTFSLPPLDRRDRQKLFEIQAAAVGVDVYPTRTDRIMGEAASGNPLFLSCAARSLGMFPKKSLETPRFQFEITEGMTPSDLCEIVFGRLEEVFSSQGPRIVRDLLSLIAYSRNGLAENEVLELLGEPEKAGEPGKPLPFAVWAPLRRALKPIMIVQGGYLTFAHEAFAAAVEKRFVFSEQHILSVRERLAGFFRRSETGARHIEEYGWQLSAMKSWETLARWLSDVETFSELVLTDHLEASRYWALIEQNSSFRVLEAYSRFILEPERHLSHLPALAAFLREYGLTEKALDLERRFVDYLKTRKQPVETFHAEEALARNLFQQGEFAEAFPILLEIEKQCRDSGDRVGLAWSLLHLAIITHSRGDWEQARVQFRHSLEMFRETNDGFGLERCLCACGTALYAQANLSGAMDVFRQQERVCRSLGRMESLAESFLGQAMTLRAWGELDRALKLLLECENICRHPGFRRSLGNCLSLQAGILRLRGDLSGALALFQQAEAIFGEIQDSVGIQITLGGQASLYRSRGSLDEAARLFGEQERICRMIGNKEGLQVALGGQATILKDRGRLKEALEMTRNAEKICREMMFREGLQRVLCTQALIMQNQGDLDGALARLREAEKICREIGLRSGLQRTLEHLATVLKARGDLDGALALLKEQEQICRQLGIRLGLQAALGNQAHILYFRGDVEGAVSLFKEQERICRELGLRDRLQQALGGQAIICRTRGDWKHAGELLKEQETICLEMGLKDGLQISQYNQGIILLIRGDLDGAMVLFRKQEELCRQAGYREGLQASLGSQAVIHRNRGDLLRSMALFQEQEKICRESGYKEGLQVSLCGQSAILQASGDFDIAMAKLKEGEKICRDLGHKEGLQRVLCSQSVIFRSRGETDRAMALLKEVETICRGLDYKSGLQRALEYQAAILQGKGELDRAMLLLKEQEMICRELGIKAGLQAAIGQQALILHKRGDLDGALALLKEQEMICQELGLKAGLARAMANQAEVMAKKFDRTNEAMQLVNQAYRLARSHGLNSLSTQIQAVLASVQHPGNPNQQRVNPDDWKNFQTQMAEKIAFVHDPGNPQASLDKLRHQERLCRELDMPTELANSLAGQALILRELGDCEWAIQLFKVEEKIQRKQENKSALLECLLNQALLLILDLRRPREALPIAEEAYRLSETHELPELSQQLFKQLLDFVHSQMK